MTWNVRDRPNFADLVVRKKLAPRKEPYFHLICIGRALGYQKKDKHRSYWVVRVRKQDGRYIYERLGETDDHRDSDGITYLDFSQALLAAQSWFVSSDSRSSFSLPRPRIPPRELLPPGDGSDYTVCHAMHDLMAWRRLTSGSDWHQCTVYLINCHIIPRIGHIEVDFFTGEHFQFLVREVLESPTTLAEKARGIRHTIEGMDAELLRRKKNRVNAISSVLRDGLKLAWESGRTHNGRAWRTVRRFRAVHRPKEIFFSRDQCKLLLKELPSDLQRLALAALYTGCRASELLRLNAKDVAREGFGINVQGAKGGRPRFVFLPDEGMAFFLDLAKGKNPEDPLFTRDNSTQRRLRADFRYRFKLAVRRATLPDEFSFHGLRHTYASQLIATGTPPKVIADQLGHKSLQMVHEVYGHLAPQIRESEIQKRFSSVSREYSKLATKKKPALIKLRKKLYGKNWKPYAQIR